MDAPLLRDLGAVINVHGYTTIGRGVAIEVSTKGCGRTVALGTMIYINKAISNLRVLGIHLINYS